MTKRSTILTLTALFSLTAILAGCVGYGSYPEGPGTNNPNDPRMAEVTTEGLLWVLTRYPPESADGRFAVNLPFGTSRSTYAFIARKVGGVPVTEGMGDLPVYHVARINVRGSLATMDIMRPAPDMGARYVGVQLELEAGLKPWRVIKQRTWSEGTVRVPELNPLPPEAKKVAPGDAAQ